MEYKLYKLVTTGESIREAGSDWEAYNAARAELLDRVLYGEGEYIVLDATNRRWVSDLRVEDYRRILDERLAHARMTLQAMPRLPVSEEELKRR